MKKRKMTPFGLAVAVLVLLVIAFVVRGSVGSSVRITLPPAQSAAPGGDSAAGTAERLDRVEVTPATVQTVIAVLSRPDNYRRSITIERYWDGGSSTAAAETAVMGAYSRCDLRDGQLVRHVVTNGESTAVWYGGETQVYRAAALFSADAEQGVPTYEDILALDPASIAAADYRLVESIPCIFVETAPDDAGYVRRFCISTDTGLLVAAETLCGDETIYRMKSLSASPDVVTEADFALPDGSAL